MVVEWPAIGVAGAERPVLEYSSQRRHTAVHEQQGAGDVGGIVGGQKQDRGGDLLGPARALQHGALCGLGVILLDGLAGRCDAALMEERPSPADCTGQMPHSGSQMPLASVRVENPQTPMTSTK